jgi:hypothetical protein
MTEVESLKAEVKKLSSRALQAKMDLHDLSEELPDNWEKILTVAERAHQAFRSLEAKRAELLRVDGGGV